MDCNIKFNQIYINSLLEYQISIRDKHYILNEIDFLKFCTSFIRSLDEILYAIEIDKRGVFPVIESDISGYILKIIFETDKIYIEFNSIVDKINISGLQSFCKRICDFLNSNYTKNIIDIKKINPIFLEHMLGVDLPFLFSTKLEYININDLRVFYRENNNGISEGIKIENSRFYEELINNNYNKINLSTNHIFENNKTRTISILESIKCFNYPKDENYIIIYNDENIVRDGEHRLACLYFLYGNINIPVRRLYFSKNYYSFSRYYKLLNKRFI